MSNVDTVRESAPSWCALCENSVGRDPVYFKPRGSQFTERLIDTQKLSEGWLMSRCRSCGLISVDPLPSETELLAQYNSDYYTETLHRGQIGDLMVRKALGHSKVRWPWSGWSQQRAHVRNIKHLRKLSAKLGTPTSKPRLVDVGCGTGEVLAAARDLHWNAVGIEVSQTAAEQAENESGFPIICGPLDRVALEKESFDIVHLCEVLEHVRMPATLLRRIAGWLRPGGILYVQVPNDLAGYRPRFFREPWWMFPPIHLHYFTQEVLSQVLADCGFEQIAAGSLADAVGIDFRRFLSWRLGWLPVLDALQGRRTVAGVLYKASQVMWDYVLFAPARWIFTAMNAGFTSWIIVRKRA